MGIGGVCAMSGRDLTEWVTGPRGGTEKTHWNLGKSFQGNARSSTKVLRPAHTWSV